MCDADLCDSLRCHIGRTVTIFTTSGGISGSGFTGVLAAVCDGVVKLITCIGAPPCCALGSACGVPGGGCGTSVSGGSGCGCGGGYSYGGFGGAFENRNFGVSNKFNWLGSVTEIPICRIASFVHNTI